MSNHEKLLSKMNQGKTANVIYQNISPIIAKKSDAILAQLKTNFRTGELDHLKTQCLIAQLCGYDDLLSELKGNINSGEHAAKKLMEANNE